MVISRAWLLPTAAMVMLAACDTQPDPSLDEEQANAIANASAEIEDIAEDGLTATENAGNDRESMEQAGSAPNNAN